MTTKQGHLHLKNMKYLFPLALFAFASCVLPSDIQGLRRNMDDFQAGVVTKPVFDQRNADIAAEIDRRNAATLEAAQSIPKDPLSLLLYLGGALGTAAASIKGTNVVRDSRRRARKEPV